LRRRATPLSVDAPGLSTAVESDATRVRLFVDGAWREGRGGSLIIEDPGTATAIGRVSLADDADLRDAVRAADSASRPWSALPAAERGRVLRRAAQILEDRAQEIGEALSRESGKPAADAQAELARSCENLSWNGEEATRLEGRVLTGKTEGSQRLLLPTPIGVVAAFTAWNFPALLVTRKLGAILAAGCTAVLKAAEATPFTAAAVVQALADAGAPRGVVNLVFGDPEQVSRHSSPLPRCRA
jgi:succinate-semialdehyde dehydrogenase/glutarate-semialdehyde dehydrogenase